MQFLFLRTCLPKKFLANCLILFQLAPFSIPIASAAPGDETTFYFLNDHLASVDAVLDEDGNVLERRDYLPYGQERYVHEELNAPDTAQGFTDKELDDETGLNYYGARYYDSEIGRFIMSDPWQGDLRNPQTLNRYSYVLDNPLFYADPSGMVPDPTDAIALAAGPMAPVVLFAKEAVESLIIAGIVTSLTGKASDGILTTPVIPQSDPVIVDTAPAQPKNSPLVTPENTQTAPDFTYIPVTPSDNMPLTFPVYEGIQGACGVNMTCAVSDDSMNPHTIPLEGIPNSTRLKWENGRIKEGRTYDEEGKVSEDYHNTNHGNPETHEEPHRHEWRTNPETGKSERIN